MTTPRRFCYPLLLLSIGSAFMLALFLANTLSAAPNGDYALKFDGTSDFVELGSASDIIGASWQSAKTISLWVRPMGTGPVGEAVSGDMIFGDFPRWFGIYQATSGGQDRIWIINYDNNADGDGVDQIGIPYTQGEWVHIAFVQGGGILYAYKNGVLVGSTGTGPTANGHPGAIGGIKLRIGGAVGSSWNVLSDEQIDEVQIWDVPRSAQEIRRDMFRILSGTEPGLRAYYRMSNGSGTLLTDDSANSFDGTLRDGGASVPADGDTAVWAASGALTGPRNALDFDGVNDYVNIGSNAATVIGGTWADTKSVDVWLQPGAAGDVTTTAAQGDWIVGGANWGVSQASIGGLDRLWVWNNDGSEDRIGLLYTPGTWTHVALVHSGGTLTVYQDGQAVGSTASGSTVSDDTLTIGGRTAGQYFQGQIDDLRIWNDARSLLEVQDNAYQTAASDEAGLAAYYRFDQANEAGQTEVVDSTSNGRHGTMTNMDPNADWMLSTAFNTWIGGDSQVWGSGGNWSRYTATTTRLGIMQYPNSYSATVTTPTTIIDARLVTDANLVVSDVLTVTTALVGPGQVTVNNTLVNLGNMEVTTVTVASGALLNVGNGGALTVTGSLQNNGTLRQTQPVAGSDVVSFVNAGGYGGLTMKAGGQNLGNTVVTIRGHQNCTSVPNETVRRCFDITPEFMPAVGITMTFAFDDSEIPGGMSCETLSLYHWNGSGWDGIIPTVRDCTQSLNVVTVENVTSFSPFVLRSPDSPTAVTLQSFSVERGTNWLVIVPVIVLMAMTGVLLIRRARGVASGVAP